MVAIDQSGFDPVTAEEPVRTVSSTADAEGASRSPAPALRLFVLAEGVAHGLAPRLLPYFLSSRLVSEANRPRFREIVRSVARLRDRTLPWGRDPRAGAGLADLPPPRAA